MKAAIAVLLSAMLIPCVSSSLLAKEKTSKITISGVGIKRPIEIIDPKILANFMVWTGPGTSGADRQGLIIDWSEGPVRETPNTLRRYQVSFYAGASPQERMVYVVYYVINPDAGPGYVYLPGKSDEYYRLNVHSIFRGEEGKWFPAWNAWERVARPLIEKAERTDSIQSR
jgi:hypothetical protein